MGSSYQTVLVTGDRSAARLALLRSWQRGVILPVGRLRWAVVPRARHGYAETANLARQASLATGGYAARFEVFDSDVLSAEIFHDGVSVHEYHSDQGYVIEDFDDDDEPILVDRLGRTFRDESAVVHGPFGDDPERFAPLGLGDVDLATLGAALRGPERAETQHHEILHALNLTPGPLQMTYPEARGA
jgi:hypothetical protein